MNHCCSAHIISSLWKKKCKEISHSLAIPCFPIDFISHLLGVASCSSQGGKLKTEQRAYVWCMIRRLWDIRFSSLGLFQFCWLVSPLTTKYLADVHCRRRLKTFCFSLSVLARILFCCFFTLAIFLAKYILSATILLLQCQVLKSGYC